MRNCFLVLFLLGIPSGFSQSSDFDYLPSCDNQLVKHQYYALCYSEEHEQAAWVAYELTKSEVLSNLERTDDFRSDPAVDSGSASLGDYKKSGYDRGHLAPAADFKFSPTAMSESFYLSNMSPQVAGFNRGIWKQLESLVRTWAVDNDQIYVVTGPIFARPLGSIGSNGVTVPGSYYKVILDHSQPDLKAIAFIMRNAAGQKGVRNFSTSIDQVEMVTGIDFFPQLEDSLENELEGSLDVSQWSFDVKSYSYGSSSSSATQCKGNTVSGDRCRRKTKDASGYCWQHVNQSKTSSSPARSASPNVTVCVAKSGKKYHRCSCSYLKKSKLTISLRDARARGHSPCSRCNPPK
jgi:endonuclease G, mitochondrial